MCAATLHAHDGRLQSNAASLRLSGAVLNWGAEDVKAVCAHVQRYRRPCRLRFTVSLTVAAALQGHAFVDVTGSGEVTVRGEGRQSDSGAGTA